MVDSVIGKGPTESEVVQVVSLEEDDINDQKCGGWYNNNGPEGLPSGTNVKPTYRSVRYQEFNTDSVAACNIAIPMSLINHHK